MMMFGICNSASSQIDSFRKKIEYFSVAGEGFLPIGTNITSDGNRNPLEHYRIPGISLGGDYQRVGRRGFTFVTGLHYRKLPVSFQYIAQPSDYAGPPEWKTDLVEKFGNLSLGQAYIPLKVGYTAQSSGKRWKPSFLAGVNLNHLLSSELQYETTLGDNSNRFQLFEFRLASPETSRLWTSYTASANISRTLKWGNQFFIGFTANISTMNVYNGEYAFFFKDATQTGIYTEKGSYVGVHFGYSFLRKAK